MKADKKLKPSDLRWSDYGWWVRSPDGSIHLVHIEPTNKPIQHTAVR